MSMASMEIAIASPAPLGALPAGWRPPIGHGTFAEAMAAVDVRRDSPNASQAVTAPSPAPSIDSRSALGALARRLDEVGRHRVEAQALSDALAGAWASGVDVSALAVSMHRQARAMASYNLSVMWGAKLIGVTAGALRQLVSAT